MTRGLGLAQVTRALPRSHVFSLAFAVCTWPHQMRPLRAYCVPSQFVRSLVIYEQDEGDGERDPQVC